MARIDNEAILGVPRKKGEMAKRKISGQDKATEEEEKVEVVVKFSPYFLLIECPSEGNFFSVFFHFFPVWLPRVDPEDKDLRWNGLNGFLGVFI